MAIDDISFYEHGSVILEIPAAVNNEPVEDITYGSLTFFTSLIMEIKKISAIFKLVRRVR